MKWRREAVVLLLSIAMLSVSTVAPALAAQFQSSSSNYGVNEVFFGSGGSLSSSSSNYQAQMAAGELAVGSSTSNNYQMHAGFNTNDQPLLEFAVNGGTYDLGVLSSTSTSTPTPAPTFTVRNYLSDGYIVTVNGTPPVSNNGYTLTAMSTAGTSQIGTEQFGINLVNNTSPTVGSNPVQVPNNTFSFGSAFGAYATQNQFKFANGDTIAQSLSSTGQTNYTLSIIANISKTTPSGNYTGRLSLVVVSTF